ncbi:MAG: cell division protein SepF [Firmicutes bacterium]|nr:cell division protein SepF [Bacillota bacterium]
MAGLMDKISGVLFREQEEANYMDENEAEGFAANNERNLWREQEPIMKPKRANITALPSKNEGTMEIVIIKATSYDDLEVIADHIKSNKVVVVNFDGIDKDAAQHMVNFLSGTTYAFNSSPKKVAGGTFIFSSDAVNFVGSLDEDSSKHSNNFPWYKKA